MYSISAVIITFNEEQNIKRCLNSLAGVVDEVVIVDSFSTDGTSSVVNSLIDSFMSINFIEREWEGYSSAKNFGNQVAKGKYILSIDADEELDKELRTSISELILDGSSYQFNRKNYLEGKWIKYCGWYPDKKLRLFPKGSALWKGDFVHEELIAEHASTLLQGHLNHYTAKNKEKHLETIRKYSTLNAQSYIRRGKNYTFVKSLLQAIAVFVKIYILKQGFRDGHIGRKIAWRSAYGRILRYKEYVRLKEDHSFESSR